MKRLNTNALAAGAMLSLFCAPLALAQPAPQHGPPGPPGAPNAPPHIVQVQPQHPPMPMPMNHGGPPPAPHQQMQISHNAPYAGHPPPPPRPPVQYVQSGHHWHNGDRFNGDRRVVGNWSYYHLHQPPQGYEWVQDGSQFVLIAVATGVITDVILNAIAQ